MSVEKAVKVSTDLTEEEYAVLTGLLEAHPEPLLLDSEDIARSALRKIQAGSQEVVRYLDSSAYTTEQLRQMIDRLQADGWQKPKEGTLEFVAYLAYGEIEELPMVLCEYMDESRRRKSSRGNQSDLWSDDDFEMARDNFKGAAYGSPKDACEDDLQEKFGASVRDSLGEYIHWGAYRTHEFTGVLVEYQGMHYHFTGWL